MFNRIRFLVVWKYSAVSLSDRGRGIEVKCNVSCQGRFNLNLQLNFIVHIPDVAYERVGTALNGPGGQSKLISQQVDVRAGRILFDDGQLVEHVLQRARPRAEQYVSERRGLRRHVRREQIPFHLRTKTTSRGHVFCSVKRKRKIKVEIYY